MALTFLRKNGHVVVETGAKGSRTKIARLTTKGHEAHLAPPTVHDTVAHAWQQRFGGDVRRLRAATRSLLEQRAGDRARLTLGLTPYPDGWRANGRYAERTAAMLDDPHTGLPQYPIVLNRGGWPDGS